MRKAIIFSILCYLLSACSGNAQPSHSDVESQIKKELESQVAGDLIKYGISNVTYDNGWVVDDNNYAASVIYTVTILEPISKNEGVGFGLGANLFVLLVSKVGHVPKVGESANVSAAYNFRKTEKGWQLTGPTK
jgi:hypothetical protein